MTVVNVFALFVVMAIGFGGVALWIWVLIDCVTNESSEGNDRIIWALVIALVGPIGALLYFVVRRPTRIAQFGR